MTKNERIAIASRWTTAMSKKGATPLKALAEVLAKDVLTTSLSGKEAVLGWFQTSPGMSMFRTGTWLEPTVSGDVVSVVCRFDPKAAYLQATVSITVDPSGLITEARAAILAAPDPLGSVINRVWGPRAGIDRLPGHLATTYGMKVKALKPLDNGVFQAGTAIIRLFPSDRPVAGVEGDAAILRFLEDEGFPAERCLEDVSVHEGQGVLVTGFVKGAKPKPSAASEAGLADLLGRLQTMTKLPKAAKRPAGGQHLYTVDATIAGEMATARAALEAGTFRGTDKAYDALAAGLRAATDFAALPKALLHPDIGCANVISSGGKLVLIDWGGAGSGPRILALGLLLHSAADGKTFNREWTDAIMEAYSQHVKLKPAELDALEAAIQHRPMIHQVYAWCVAKAQRRPLGHRWWPHDNEGIARMADHIRQNWG